MGKNRQLAVLVTLSSVLMIAGPLYGGGSHSHSHDDEDSQQHDSAMQKMSGNSKQKGEMFLIKKNIDGFEVTFHVMKAKPGKHMGGSHDFMVKVEKEGKALTDIVMNTKVVHPDGKSEIRRTMQMGDWQMAGYDLGHEGSHQMMILFKTSDGRKHKGGVFYP